MKSRLSGFMQTVIVALVVLVTTATIMALFKDAEGYVSHLESVTIFTVTGLVVLILSIARDVYYQAKAPFINQMTIYEENINREPGQVKVSATNRLGKDANNLTVIETKNGDTIQLFVLGELKGGDALKVYDTDTGDLLFKLGEAEVNKQNKNLPKKKK